MAFRLDESKVLLAIKAIEKEPKLSLRAAAKIYEDNRSTLARRRAGRIARCDTRPNLTILTESDEQAIIQYVLDLATRSFPPRLRGVEEIANQLLRVRNAPPVGKNWVQKFIKRQLELRTRWSRKYDY